MKPTTSERINPTRFSRRRHPRSFERLEDRTLLATIPANATRLTGPNAQVVDAPIAPGVPIFYEINPTTDAYLDAQLQARGALIRLSLLDSQGNLLVQSDGPSATGSDDRIAQHVVAGTDYLELQSLDGAGTYTLTTTELPENDQPGQPTPVETNGGVTTFPAVFGDFRGQGILDFVESDGVHLGVGDGTFQTPSEPLPTSFEASEATATITGDFNHDGHLDLAIGFSVQDPTTFATTGYLQLLMGNGDGTFSAETPIDLGDFSPTSLVAADLTGDGLTDLAAVGADSSGNTSVMVLLNNGDGTITLKQTIPLGSVIPTALVAGDFGNGRADLAVAEVGFSPDGTFNASIDVLLGNGDGTFPDMPTNVFLGDFNPTALVAGDFTGDGHDDLAVTGFALSSDPGVNPINSIDVLPSNDGEFLAARTIPLGDFYPGPLVAGDFNGDGHVDFAVAGVNSTGNDSVEVLLGDGNQTFVTEPTIALGDLTPISLAAGDFNRDDRLDLAVFGADADLNFGLQVLQGKGDGTYSTTVKPISISDSQPSSVQGPFVSGDFNGDTRPDLATIGFDLSGNTNVEVQLGNGDGTFQDASTIPLPGNFSSGDPTYLISGDFNRDGRLDLAAAGIDSSSGDATIDVLLGNGDGTFHAESPIDLGDFTLTALVAGDFDGNGFTDLAVAGTDSSGNASIEVLPGNGDGTFPALPTIDPLGDFSPTALVAGDFTGNGLDDLAAAGTDSSGNASIDVLLSHDGTFPDIMNDPLGNIVAQTSLDQTSMIPIDLVTVLNRDGRLDLVAAGDDSRDHITVDVLSGQGDGTFDVTPGSIDLGEGDFEGLLTGDFNGDLNPDLAVVSRVSPFLPSNYDVLPGDGTGTFSVQNGVVSTLTQFAIPTVTGDFNGDGRTDLAFNTSASGVKPEISLGNGQFAPPGSFTGAIQDNPLVADPGDGTEDVFIVDQAGDIMWRKGTGKPGSFGPPVTINLDPTTNQVVPSRDIALISTRQGTMIASVDLRDNAVSLFAYRDGQFVKDGSLATGLVPAQVATADLNDDGNLDLVVLNAGDGTASVFLGDGNGGFTKEPDDVSIGLGASDIALAALDGSGHIDLIVTNQLTGDVRVLPGNGDGTFGNPSIYQAGSGPYGLNTDSLTSQEATAGVAVGTFIAGGKADIAVVNPGSNTFGVLNGLGSGAFANTSLTFTSSSAGIIRVGDFNGDGLSDVAVLGPDGVSVDLSNGNGTFQAPTIYPVGPDPTGLTVADVTGDGILDLVVGNAHGDVLVLQGQGNGLFEPYIRGDGRITLAVADTSENGQPGFVFANKGSDRIAIQVGPQSPLTTLASRSQGILDPGADVSVYFPGDPIPDVVVTNGGGNDVWVFPALGNGQTGPAQFYAVGTDPVGITVADLNGDGIPDLIVANQDSNDLSILYGQGTGSDWTLTPGPRLRAGSGPTATAVSDVNGDGIPDILVSDTQSNDVRLIMGLGKGFFNDTNPATFETGVNPGPIFVGPFTDPGHVDVVTLNAGSNNLSLIHDVNDEDRGLVAQTETIISGGSVPIAAVEGDFGGGGQDLLVGNNGDGVLAMFLGGSGGFALSRTFTDPDLPNPTALTMDPSTGEVFGGSEGSEAAIQVPVVLGLGLGTVGSSTAILGPTSGNESLGFSSLSEGAAEQQVALLQPLSESSLALVATLLSVTVVTTDQGVTVSDEATAVAAPGATSSAALPNQATSGGRTGGARGEGEGDDAQTTPNPAQEVPAALMRFVAGLEDAFNRARLDARRDGLIKSVARPRSPEAVIHALDALLARWSPVINVVSGPHRALAVDLGRAGLAAARVVDAALQSLETDHVIDRIQGPASRAPVAVLTTSPSSVVAVGLATIGLAMTVRPIHDLIRPSAFRETDENSTM